MVKIIETNISHDQNKGIADFQSRVIEVDSWESYVREIEDCVCKSRPAVIGTMHGASMPRQARLMYIEADEFHLQCEFKNFAGRSLSKLAYLARED